MANDSNPTRLLDRAVGACTAVLIGAMALYGAVQIICAVWVPLCIGALILGGLGGGWLVARRTRGW
ncbi:hypothetical protein [Luteipulveratus mongoliensis]|uniref:Uncharacterized protein n=1 Tax=Luteipulveratus mongoliensis TaxID=571913 RepID=A0A0K1JNM4_9MICO|nr:hypothetical protein [Luteipulveratus mongoliensis]AKU18193.1 hypothetical protein VV02_23995 [Luteipulveratus mongoliensis]